MTARVPERCTPTHTHTHTLWLEITCVCVCNEAEPNSRQENAGTRKVLEGDPFDKSRYRWRSYSSPATDPGNVPTCRPLLPWTRIDKSVLVRTTNTRNIN